MVVVVVVIVFVVVVVVAFVVGGLRNPILFQVGASCRTKQKENNKRLVTG